MSPTIAVIRHAPAGDHHHIVATAIDGQLAGLVVFKSTASTQEVLIDAFLDLWNTHRDNGAIVYVNDATVRHLLATSPLENLWVRNVVTGDTLRESDYAAHSAVAATRHDLAQAAQPQRPESMVVATDASRGTRRTTGIAYATDSGKLKAKVINAASCHEGEFAAVTMAVRRYEGQLSHLEILTDSRTVARALNNPHARRYGEYRSECINVVARARKTMEITVTWVRGHSGDLLNEVANRAAIAARRCCEFGTGNLGYFLAGLREELNTALTGGAFDTDYELAA